MPETLRQWEDSLRQPALCELLPVRDYLDGCIIRTNGCFVAGYEASGLNTFFHPDDMRSRTKEALEALVRSLPERSMRMQVRYEVTDGHGDLTERYVKEQRIDSGLLTLNILQTVGSPVHAPDSVLHRADQTQSPRPRAFVSIRKSWSSLTAD